MADSRIVGLVARKRGSRRLLDGLGALAAGICFLSLTAAIPPAAAWDELIVLTSDFSSVGAVCSAERYDPWSVTIDREFVSGDAIGRYHGGRYYIVNRGGPSNIQVLDPGQGYQTLHQFSVGVGRNPQDIAFDSQGEAYVSCYDEAVLLKVDPETGQILDSFSTLGFADADGLPETGWMQAVDDLLFVTCQRLDRNNLYLPAGNGVLGLFDMIGESWIDTDPGTPQVDGISLLYPNPYCKMELQRDRQRLRVGSNGAYGWFDAGLEEIDVGSQASLGMIIDETALGGDLIDFVTVNDTLGFVIVSDASFNTSLRSFNPATGGDVRVVATAPGFHLYDLAYDGRNLLYLADRNPQQPGLRVFDTGTGLELTAQPRFTGLPPTHVVLPVDEALVPVPAPIAAALRLEPPWPNPANPGSTIRFRGPSLSEISLEIFDLRGRRLRVATARTGPDGEGRFHFDGLDDAGSPVASGSYRVLVRNRGQRAVSGFTIVR